MFKACALKNSSIELTTRAHNEYISTTVHNIHYYRYSIVYDIYLLCYQGQFVFGLDPNNRELKQPRRRRQQKSRKFAYLTMKTVFLYAFHVHFSSFEDVLVLSTTWNDLFCSCVDDVSIWWQMFNFVFFCPKRWFQFNFRMVRTHFSSIMSLNNSKMVAETRSYIFGWRSRFRRRRVCLSSLIMVWYRNTTVSVHIYIFMFFVIKGIPYQERLYAV